MMVDERCKQGTVIVGGWVCVGASGALRVAGVGGEGFSGEMGRVFFNREPAGQGEEEGNDCNNTGAVKYGLEAGALIYERKEKGRNGGSQIGGGKDSGDSAGAQSGGSENSGEYVDGRER